jgi:hypothetical protein
MTVTIELTAEMESALNAMAQARGLPLADLVVGLLENQLPTGAVHVSARERAQLWREAARELPARPPLSDEAMSRESFYGERA